MKSILLSILLFASPILVSAATVSDELIVVFESIERSVEASGSFSFDIASTEFPEGSSIQCDAVSTTTAADFVYELALGTQGLTQRTLDKALADLLDLFGTDEIARCTSSVSSRYYDTEYTLFSSRAFSILFAVAREN